MRINHNPLTKVMAFTSLLGGSAFMGFSHAQANVDAPVTEMIEANSDIDVIAPTNTFYGTRGLSQTASAEALGEGRLIFGVQGAWFQQQKAFTGGPNVNANIFTGIGSASLGINRHIDVFVSLAGYGSTDYHSSQGSGLGSMGGGLQGTLPFEPSTPIRMAGQVGIYQGLSNNAIDSNHADGYNYFETRSGLDFMARLVQTLVFGNESQAFKLHLNEGIVTSAESGTDPLLLFAAGAQFNVLPILVLGIEGNARTPIKKINIASDPLWITPSVQFRTPYDINVTLGGDVALSRNRAGNSTRALEPFRLFAGMAFTFDTEEGKRNSAREKERREALEKRKLQLNNNDLAFNLVKQTREDSLSRLRQRRESDSTAKVLAMKSHQDSVQMAARAHQDSLALLDSQNKLAEEKSKRSEAEKQLLSTGLLLMDAVYFETNKTDISINSKPYLNIIAKMLTKYPKLQIEVAGHTDNVGSDEHNQVLSQGRSQSVLTYMTEVAPELKNVLSAKGYGESKPKADNSSAAGRKLNRRTELQVLNKEVLKEYNP